MIGSIREATLGPPALECQRGWYGADVGVGGVMQSGARRHPLDLPLRRYIIDASRGLMGVRAGRLSRGRADSGLAKREGDAAASPPLIVSRKQRNSGTADGSLFRCSAVPAGCHSLPSVTWSRLAGCGNADRTLTRGLSIWSWCPTPGLKCPALR